MSEGTVAEADITKNIVDRAIAQRDALKLRNAGTAARPENRLIEKPIKVDGKELLPDGGFGFISKSMIKLVNGGYVEADYSPRKGMSDDAKNSVLVDEAGGEVTEKTVEKTFADIDSVKAQLLALGMTKEQFDARMNEAYANVGLPVPEAPVEKRKGWTFNLKR